MNSDDQEVNMMTPARKRGSRTPRADEPPTNTDEYAVDPDTGRPMRRRVGDPIIDQIDKKLGVLLKIITAVTAFYGILTAGLIILRDKLQAPAIEAAEATSKLAVAVESLTVQVNRNGGLWDSRFRDVQFQVCVVQRQLEKTANSNPQYCADKYFRSPNGQPHDRD